MNPPSAIRRPVLARHARYRWDTIRGQHQLVFPEGMLVLNESGAAIVQHCDGRSLDDLVDALKSRFADCDPADDVQAFLGRLAERGLLLESGD